MVTRLVGTVDVDGSGTQHPLDQVDPFILLDAASISKHNMPPFGNHPHRGHSVVTVLLRGSMKSWDSFSNTETTLTAPASYWVDAGSGLFHNEVSVINDEKDTAQHVGLLQLWVGVKQEDRLELPPSAAL
jgi:redox-sensitive bicupin YhaK (pirin superfamily)